MAASSRAKSSGGGGQYRLGLPTDLDDRAGVVGDYVGIYDFTVMFERVDLACCDASF